MVYTELTKKAMNIAYKAHDGQFDKCGFPYICHPIHLAESIITALPVYKDIIIPNNNDEYLKNIPNDKVNEYLTCVALLHDVVEDTDITIEYLSKEFPFIVTEAVDLLTHRPGVDYFDYIYKIKSNFLARSIKILDILHNKNKEREVLIDDESQDKKDARDEKYRKALRILTDDSYKKGE